MNPTVTLELWPQGKTLVVARGGSLQDLLFPLGVEFPCGGRGRCRGCKIKLLAGHLPVSSEEQKLFSPDELKAGWRLACRHQAQSDLKLELAQWEATILTEHPEFEFTPATGLGVAVDVGTTTLVAQLLDLQTGHVLAVQTALNAQARHGADIMSRIEFAVRGHQRELERLIREQIGGLIDALLATSPHGAGDLTAIILVGNTVMHHLFCGVDVSPLAHHPFEPIDTGLHGFTGRQLGWTATGEAAVYFLPCLGGFVGSDILAGVLAIGLHQAAEPTALVDLGTNGEIVVGNRQRLLCASTAAGPAFEGARISQGMRAATGAIASVSRADGQFRCHVLGGGEPRGICGSGLVDAVAVALDLGLIQANGRLAHGDALVLLPPVQLTQADIRELQLAKGAIAAGLRMLTAQWGATLADITRLYLAGAFGNYINRASARRIGLLPLPPDKVEPAGNTALLGAKMALFHLAGQGDLDYPAVRANIQHVPLNEDPQFYDVFMAEMAFPALAGC